MTREVFLNDLKAALSGMDAQETESVIAYYGEMIDDRMEAGMTEADAVNAMEPVATIAARVLSEAGVEAAAEEAETAEEPKEEKPESEKEIRRSAETVSELVVLAENQRVNITAGDTEEIVLRYRIEDGDIYQLHEENGVLTLEHKHRPVSSYKFDPSKVTAENFIDEIGKFIGSINLGNLFSINSLTGDARSIEVILPRIFKGKLRVKTSNERITADQVTCLDEVKLQTSNARTVIGHLVARTLTAGTSNARIMMNDVYVREQLDAGTSNGRLILENVTSDQGMNLHTSNASVRLEAVDAGTLEIRTSNGSVSGTLKGKEEEYAVRSGTSNGKNNLTDREDGERRLYVKTSNAHINLEFIG